ncbi:hypothetical protein RIU76_06465 [Latilactobacillus sakei subsp. sakei]|uniref:hypothetical protein n=1 Tax=Latilactobacillus sakei TaxID=1599 RepID=UPI0028630CEA|nr:hypothetical protein [Latilactobacillus sakei]MDR7924368.1 hypothetical protein [Latilactobacillus sakei subsp. sakei]
MGLTMDNMIFVVMVQRGGIYSTDVAFKTMKAAEAYIYAKNHELEPDGFRYLAKTFLQDK